MTEDLPSREVLQRWRGEPVRALIFPTSIFLTNKKGYPVLSKVRTCTHACMHACVCAVLARVDAIERKESLREHTTCTQTLL